MISLSRTPALSRSPLLRDRRVGIDRELQSVRARQFGNRSTGRRRRRLRPNLQGGGRAVAAPPPPSRGPRNVVRCPLPSWLAGRAPVLPGEHPPAAAGARRALPRGGTPGAAEKG